MTDDFSSALISFKKAEEASDTNDSGLKSRIKAWINKSTIELGNENAGNINDSIYLKNDKPAQVSAPVSTPTPVIEHPNVSTEESSYSGDVKSIKELSHDWYQNTEFVFFEYIKEENKGRCINNNWPR